MTVTAVYGTLLLPGGVGGVPALSSLVRSYDQQLVRWHGRDWSGQVALVQVVHADHTPQAVVPGVAGSCTKA